MDDWTCSTSTTSSGQDWIVTGIGHRYTITKVHVHDLKSLQKQISLMSDRKGIENLKNGWFNPESIESIYKERIKPIKKVIRNNLPVKIRIND